VARFCLRFHFLAVRFFWASSDGRPSTQITWIVFDFFRYTLYNSDAGKSSGETRRRTDNMEAQLGGQTNFSNVCQCHCMENRSGRSSASLNNNIRQHMEEVSIVRGDGQCFMPLVELLAKVPTATDAVHCCRVQSFYVFIRHLPGQTSSVKL